MIQPTVGRMVWFWPSSRPVGDRIKPDQPLAAIIVCVHNDMGVNLTVLHQDGTPEPTQDVYLWPGEEITPRPKTGSFCEWMPYQKGQASKTEALEQAIAQGYTKP